ncbi:hypothetical protein ACIBG6_05850 [Streptomyces sp. NPDC050842]|uniref:hypothetical protein n=1 Tax=Streptomyces sp. NPDC050842 TaxID=3365636 RepID=UPI0037B1D179
MDAEEVADHDGREVGDRFDHGGVAGVDAWQIVLPHLSVDAVNVAWAARRLAGEEESGRAVVCLLKHGDAGAGDLPLDQDGELGRQEDRVAAEGEVGVITVPAKSVGRELDET